METKTPALIDNDRTRTTVNHLDFIWIHSPYNSPFVDIRVPTSQEGQIRMPSRSQKGPPVNRLVAQTETARNHIGPGYSRDRRQSGFQLPAGLKRWQGSAIAGKTDQRLASNFVHEV